MIEINGSQGEGGGQILRSSLALSMATGQPFRITSIRAGRAKPGLMRQHLTCVQAAASISGAAVTGAAVGSTEVTFAPGPVKAGAYHFPIGTAGSTTMVLQAILPALLRAHGPSTISVEGGTHNRAAPPFEFFERTLLPQLNQMGPTVRARLERHGFYPAGGGRIVIDAQPGEPRPFELMHRGPAVGHAAFALISRLPGSIAQRELAVVRERLGLNPEQAHFVNVEGALCPGNAVVVELRYQCITEVVSSIGEVGRSGEHVARDAADQARAYIAAERPVGEHLADQLMVPLAVLGGGRYSTGPLSAHSTTNLGVIRAFGGDASVGEEGTVHVRCCKSVMSV